MATRFYLPYAQSATPFSRDTSAGWRAFIGTRSMSSDVPQVDTLTTRIHSGDDSGSEGPGGIWHTYVLYKQYVSPPLAAQTIPANTPWRLQCQIDKMTTAAAYATDLHYVRFKGYLVGENNSGIYSAYEGESTAAANNNEVMENRTVDGNTNIARTITSGARLVLEVGVHSVYATQPYSIPQHAMRFGYNVAGWLPSGDNTNISTTLSPWWELDHNLLFQRELSAATGSFSLGSQPTGLLGPKKLAGNPGTFGLSGKDISLARTRVLAVDPLPYALSGQDAVLALGQAMTADAGSFAVLGQDADFQKTRLITSDPGSFVIGGKIAGLTRGDTSALDAAEFTVSGQDAAFVFAPGTTFGAGVFAVSGQDAMLTYSSAPPSTGIGTRGDTLAWLLIDKPGGNW